MSGAAQAVPADQMQSIIEAVTRAVTASVREQLQQLLLAEQLLSLIHISEPTRPY